MCKILVLPVVRPDTEELAWKFIKEMSKIMSRSNTDGLGYAAVSSEGELFGERWLINRDAWDERVELPPEEREILGEYQGFLHKDEKYNKFGPVSETNVRAIMLHARAATSGRGFQNTHPFFYKDTALIHNGVIHNYEVKELKVSTCDSEKILQEYIKAGVADKPNGIRTVAKELRGYYACGVMSRDSDGIPHIDVFKSQGARLGCARIRELGCNVITTDTTDLTEVARTLNLNIDNRFDVKSGIMLRINALTGKIVSATKFKPKDEYAGSYNTNWRDTHSDTDYGGYGGVTHTHRGAGGYKGYQGKHGGRYVPADEGSAEKGYAESKEKQNVIQLPGRAVVTHEANEKAAEDGWSHDVHTKTWSKT